MDRELLRQVDAIRGTLVAAVAAGVLIAGLTIAQMSVLSRIVAHVFLDHAPLPRVWPLLLVFLATVAGRAVLIWGREMLAQRAALRAKAVLRARLAAHLLELGPAYLRGERTGELVASAVEGVERLDAYIARYLPQMLLAVAVPLLIAAYVIPLDWASGVLLLVTAPIIPLLMALIGSYAEAHIQRQWTALTRLSASFLDSIQGITTLLLFNRAQAERDRVARSSEEFRVRTMKALRYAFLSGMVLELMVSLAIALVAVTLGIRLLNGGISFEHAFLILLLAPEFYRPLRELGIQRHAGMEGKAAAQGILEVLRIPAPRQEDDSGRAMPDGPLTLTFHDVTYTYPGGEHPALEGVTLTLPAGSRTALIGPSGAGKSTLAQLVLRFIEPDSGMIAVDDLPLRALSPAVWRRYVAFVPQRPHLFHGTVGDNIRLARPGATEGEVRRAAALAGAAAFIERLPRGYDTPVGEGGARLSAGQIQRIAIARAFLKDAPILVLDEPTAHLDPESELAVRAALDRLMRDRTVLLIAHRLTTVEGADQIAVLDAGRLVEAGPPTALARHDGSYARLIARFAGRRSGVDGPMPERDQATVPAVRGLLEQNEHALAAPDGNTRVAPVVLRLLRLLWPFRLRIAGATLLGCLMVISNIGLLGMAAYVIAAAALKPLLILLTLPIYIVRLAGIARAVSRYAERLVSHDATFRLLALLRVWTYERLLPLAPARVLEYRSGDVLARLVGDVEELQHIYLRVVAPFTVALVVALLVGGLLRVFSPLLAAAALLFLAASGLGVPPVIALLSRGLGRRYLALRGTLKAHLVDYIQGMQDLLACGDARRSVSALAALDRDLGRIQKRVAAVSGLQQAGNDLLMNAAVWTALVIAIPPVARNRIDGVYLAFLALVVLGSFEAVQPLGQAFESLGHSIAAGARLFGLVEAAPAVADPPAPRPAPPGRALRFDGVCFTYHPDEAWVLQGIDFEVQAGQKVAIVGPSGSGKSTIARLALRMWDPAEGTISLDGHDLRSYRPDDVRRAIAIVAQDTYIFDDTIRGNLLVARPDATGEALWHALEGAHLADFIRGLPQGLDTPAGEHGLRLSGGERQRLAIARALLKDAPVLILDEVTANLDPETEGAVLSALETLMQGRAVVMITHRLIGMERMDEILVLDRGRIVERGTHQELCAANGLYRRYAMLAGGPHRADVYARRLAADHSRPLQSQRQTVEGGVRG